MTPQQIAKIQMLDPKNVNGTLQSVLLRSDLNEQSFDGTLYFLLKVVLMEKEGLMQENKRYFKALKEHNLMTNELLTGEK